MDRISISLFTALINGLQRHSKEYSALKEALEQRLGVNSEVMNTLQRLEDSFNQIEIFSREIEALQAHHDPQLELLADDLIGSMEQSEQVMAFFSDRSFATCDLAGDPTTDYEKECDKECDLDGDATTDYDDPIPKPEK